jgi:hypothetical protein
MPKKDGAEEISDFQPISLIHAIATTISKMLATRLSPFMPDLVSKVKVHLSKREAFMTTFFK